MGAILQWASADVVFAVQVVAVAVVKNVGEKLRSLYYGVRERQTEGVMLGAMV